MTPLAPSTCRQGEVQPELEGSTTVCCLLHAYISYETEAGRTDVQRVHAPPSVVSARECQPPALMSAMHTSSRPTTCNKHPHSPVSCTSWHNSGTDVAMHH